MSKLKLKLRYIRRPYLIKRAIIGRYKWRFSGRMRINEYKRHVHSMDEALVKLLSVNVNRIRDLKAQFSSKALHMNEAGELLGGLGGGMGEDACTLL